MSTGKNNFEHTMLAVVLSIAAMPILVNGQTHSLSSVNSDKSSRKSVISGSRQEVLIETMFKSGGDGKIGKNLAPIIGLPSPMPMKTKEILTSTNGNDFEKRAYFLIYEKVEGAGPGTHDKRPVCAYILKAKRQGLENQVEYFRINLSGILEKAILSKSRAAANGKAVRGSGVKTDLDIDSPEVRKTFDAEMDFWLNDWLKKQAKAPAKKAAGR